MEGDGAGNGLKLRRGRISLEKKREILEQYDLLSKPVSDDEAVAIFGVTKATLLKILSERDEIQGTVTVRIENVRSLSVDDSESGSLSGPKLKRGRLSYDKQKELLALYDQLPKCSYSEAASRLGIREVTLTKLLASRRSITSGNRKRKKPKVDSSSDSDYHVSPSRAQSASGLRCGPISRARQKELLEQYDNLRKPVTHQAAAAQLGISQTALTNLLASRGATTTGGSGISQSPQRGSSGIKMALRKGRRVWVDYSEDEQSGSDYKENSEKRNRKKGKVDSSSDRDVSPNRVGSAWGLRRGLISTERQRDLLEQYDNLRKPVTHQAAAAQLGISQTALTNLLASRGATTTGGSGIRQSPQPGSSRIKMALRKGRRVRVDYSEDEQSGSDYKESDSDITQDIDAELDDAEEPELGRKQTRTVKRYSLAEKQQLLAKYDELSPCPQWRAAKVLGITQSTLSNWLNHRSLISTNTKTRQSKRSKIESEEDEEDSNLSAEEIDSYVMGSTNGTQVVQFFEVSAEEPDQKSSGSTGNANAFIRKPYMTLREKFELYKKYDSMDPDSQRNAAATFNLCKSTWFNLITNRCYYEKRFKTRLCKDMDILRRYDELENKGNACKILNVPKPKLNKLLESKAVIEKYFTEIFGCNEYGESIALRVDKNESTWKDSKALRALERELLTWSKQAKDDQVINWKVLKEKAKDLAAKSGMDDFYPSDAWLKKWNKTNRVFWNKKGKLLTVYGFGENQSVSECVLTALKDYPPENVFNLVKTGLYYRAVPGYSPVTSDWVSVAFACNMSGTEKKRLLVVGRSEAPLLFRVMPLPLAYKCSSSACMTEELVCDFLQDWDQQLAETDRTIAVILDSSMSQQNVQLSRIRLFFVPTDCSQGQPLSDGVVGHAKALFRKRMAESLRSLGSARVNQNAAEKIAIVDALFVLAEAWENVPKSLLVAKFLKSTFPQNDAEEPDKDDLDDEELERLNALDEEIQLHSTSEELPFAKAELEEDRVVHMEGTLNLSEEEEEDFDIDSLLRDQDTPDYNPNPYNCGQNSPPDLGSKLKNFLQKPSKSNGSLNADQKGCGPPTASDVREALATIKKFLQLNGCTLEDLTDYTQLEIKVLSKIKNLSAASELS